MGFVLTLLFIQIGGMEMANLKRNMITLVKNPEEVTNGGEPEFEKYWTPAFMPLDVTYEAVDLMGELEKMEERSDFKKVLDLLVDFTANKAYAKQFTVEDLKGRLHAPNAVETLREQLFFVAQGEQTDETKNFLEKKR